MQTSEKVTNALDAYNAYEFFIMCVLAWLLQSIYVTFPQYVLITEKRRMYQFCILQNHVTPKPLGQNHGTSSSSIISIIMNNGIASSVGICKNYSDRA